MQKIQMPRLFRRGRAIVAIAIAGLLIGTNAASANPAVSSPGGSSLAFHTVVPSRVLDTRTGIGGSKTPLSANPARAATILGIPQDATAVVINVTAINGTNPSHLTIYAKGASMPDTSTVNWVDAHPVSSEATVALSADRAIALRNNSGTVDVVIDLLGYYSPGPALLKGDNGPAGPKGDAGPQGPDGYTGVKGATGEQGSRGLKGEAGPPGNNGLHGTNGTDGTNGTNGTNGTSGTKPAFMQATSYTPENLGTVGALHFPVRGITSSGITVRDSTSYSTDQAGIYQVSFSVTGTFADDSEFGVIIGSQSGSEVVHQPQFAPGGTSNGAQLVQGSVLVNVPTNSYFKIVALSDTGNVGNTKTYDRAGYGVVIASLLIQRVGDANLS